MAQPKDVIVTVTVDTATITQANVNQTIVLTDDNGGSDQTPGDSCTFLSNINNGAQVTFNIIAKDGSTGVSFKSFSSVRGPRVLNPLPKSPNWRSTVSGNQEDKEGYAFIINVAEKGDFNFDPEAEVKGP